METENANVREDPDVPLGNSQAPLDQSIGQIREIIFGEQMRLYEARFQDLETSLKERTESVLADLVERISSLESALRKDLDELGKNLERTNEENTRALEHARMEMQTALEEAIRQLQHQKTDRSALASIFAEFADRLNEAQI